MRFLLNAAATCTPPVSSRRIKVPNSSSSHASKVSTPSTSTSTTTTPNALMNKIKTAATTASSSSSNTAQSTIQAWGQQCSPNCGCTVRFETSIDASNHYKITSASYDAKTILSKRVPVAAVPESPVIHYENGFRKLGVSSSSSSSFRKPSSLSFLQPIMTTQSTCLGGKGKKNKAILGVDNGDATPATEAVQVRAARARPLMKPCTCKTLHALAQTVVKTLPRYTLSQAQNQLEFSGGRSSPAFRYTALNHLGLLKKQSVLGGGRSHYMDIHEIPQGHCYDLVEDALMACLHGYIPKPRKAPYHGLESYMAGNDGLVHRTHHHGGWEKDDRRKDKTDEEVLDPLRFVRAAKLRAQQRLFPSLAAAGVDESSSSSYSNAATGQELNHQPSSSPFSISSMPPFHLAVDYSSSRDHHGGYYEPVAADTLTQLRMEIQSMEENEMKASQQEEHVRNYDWVSYIDETS